LNLKYYYSIIVIQLYEKMLSFALAQRNLNSIRMTSQVQMYEEKQKEKKEKKEKELKKKEKKKIKYSELNDSWN